MSSIESVDNIKYLGMQQIFAFQFAYKENRTKIKISYSPKIVIKGHTKHGAIKNDILYQSQIQYKVPLKKLI